MIRLIKNEFLKLGILRIFIFQIIFIFVIFLLKELDYTVDTIYGYVSFVGIVICILFSNIVNKELEEGTFRYYLTKPYKRYKIYISKFMIMFITTIVLLLSILFTFIVAYKYVDASFIVKYIKYCVPLLLVISLVLFNSVIIKNSSICIGLNISCILFGILVSQILFGLKLTIVEYTFLPYLDFSIFNDLLTIENINYEFNVALSLKNGIIINIIYSVLFFLIGLIIFNKKDIKS